ncbi:unnamed protein product [Vicia faba]|uniref:Uncharacterized protein n=1 Tax=Vicia faba TaxID=3906 RepID=A0AAV1B4D4_VICFA|nr:unnamed protein product [Vicia faba]
MNDLRAPSFIARSGMSMFPPEPIYVSIKAFFIFAYDAMPAVTSLARSSSWFGSEDDPSSGKNHLSIHEPLHEEEEDAPPKGPAGAGACCEAGRSIGGVWKGLLLPNPGSPSRKSHLRLFDFNLPLSRPGQTASSSEDLLGPTRSSHYPKSLSYLIWIKEFTLRSSACRSKVIGEAAGGKHLFITPLSPEPPRKNLGLQSADECLPSYPFPIVWV